MKIFNLKLRNSFTNLRVYIRAYTVRVYRNTSIFIFHSNFHNKIISLSLLLKQFCINWFTYKNNVQLDTRYTKQQTEFCDNLCRFECNWKQNNPPRFEANYFAVDLTLQLVSIRVDCLPMIFTKGTGLRPKCQQKIIQFCIRY